MHQDDLNLDQLIENALKNNKDTIPSPPISKVDTWKIIEHRLMAEQKRNKKLSKGPGIWVASVLLLILVVTFLHPQNASAFSWFTKYFTIIQGKVTHLMGSNGQSPASGELPPPKQGFSVVNHHEHYERMSLEDAKKQTNFQILIPKYIPKGFTLKDVTVIVYADKKSNDIELNFQNGDDTISLKELFVEHQLGFGMSIDNDDTKIKEVEINNTKGKLLIFKNNLVQLIWDAPRYHFEAKGKITEEEIIKIAQSIDY